MKTTVRVSNPFTAVSLTTLFAGVVFLFTGAIVMWGLDAIHDDWAAVPALGYTASLWSVVLMNTAGTLWGLSKTK